MENGRRPRHYRTRPMRSELGNLAVFAIILVVLCVLSAAIYASLASSPPLP